MKKIEQSISEVANYFKTKVVAGDYEFIKCDEHKATVIVDEKYTLELWLANGVDFFKIYNTALSLDILDGLFVFDKSEREKGWEIIVPLVKDYRKNVLLKEKIAELENLKKEFGI